jgi:hypothetical protein
VYTGVYQERREARTRARGYNIVVIRACGASLPRSSGPPAPDLVVARTPGARSCSHPGPRCQFDLRHAEPIPEIHDGIRCFWSQPVSLFGDQVTGSREDLLAGGGGSRNPGVVPPARYLRQVMIFQLMEIPPLEDIRRERGLRSGEVALQFNLPRPLPIPKTQAVPPTSRTEAPQCHRVLSEVMTKRGGASDRRKEVRAWHHREWCRRASDRW